jgi:hypothetical protein
MNAIIRLKTPQHILTHGYNLTAEDKKLLDILNNQNILDLIPNQKKSETSRNPTNDAVRTGETANTLSNRSPRSNQDTLSNENKTSNVDHLSNEETSRNVTRAVRFRRNWHRLKREEVSEPEDEEDEIDWIEKKSCKLVLTPVLTVLNVKVRDCKKLCEEVMQKNSFKNKARGQVRLDQASLDVRLG